MNLTAREAGDIALKWLKELYSFEPVGLRIEEVEWDMAEWRITVGWFDPSARSTVKSSTGLFSELLPAATTTSSGARVYKRIRVDDETGEVQGMTIRNL